MFHNTYITVGGCGSAVNRPLIRRLQVRFLPCVILGKTLNPMFTLVEGGRQQIRHQGVNETKTVKLFGPSRMLALNKLTPFTIKQVTSTYLAFKHLIKKYNK